MSEWQPARIVIGPHADERATQQWLSLIGKVVRVKPTNLRAHADYCDGPMYVVHDDDSPDKTGYFIFCEHEIMTD